MYWKLQRLIAVDPEEDLQWVDEPGVDHTEPHRQFKSKRDAFNYYFVKHGHRREPAVPYRLAPVFSTQPVRVEFTRSRAYIQHGNWFIPDDPHSHKCTCGCHFR